MKVNESETFHKRDLTMSSFMHDTSYLKFHKKEINNASMFYIGYLKFLNEELNYDIMIKPSYLRYHTMSSYVTQVIWTFPASLSAHQVQPI